MKTNASRLLDRLGIAYELRDYPVDPQDLSAESVAVKIGLPAQQVFKTLVVRADPKLVYFAVVAGDAELDLKALAGLTGDRKLELVPLKDVQPLTGYIRGGVTVFAAKKDFPVYLDAAALSFDHIAVSAGVRGCQILMKPHDYMQAAKALVGPISKPKP